MSDMNINKQEEIDRLKRLINQAQTDIEHITQILPKYETFKKDYLKSIIEKIDNAIVAIVTYSNVYNTEIWKTNLEKEKAILAGHETNLTNLYEALER